MAGFIADLARRGPALDLSRCTVMLLMGGTSGEREVSLSSGKSLQKVLNRMQAASLIRGYQTIEVLADGRWVDGSTTAPAAAFLGNLPPDPLFLLGLHGGAGEDGTLQGLLSSLGLVFTGSGVAASSLCMDKHLSRLLFSHGGIAVAPGALVPLGPLDPEFVQACGGEGPGPWFVKPRRGGSSLATSCVEEWGQLAPALDAVRASGDQALVEQAVLGVEVTVGLLDRRGNLPQALPLVEVSPHPGRFFDYEEKYSSGGADEFCPPRNLSPERCAEVSRLAQDAYRLAGCAGYARIDFIVPPTGAPICLEINTLPGFTQRSLLPMAAREAGISFDALVERILSAAIEESTS